MKGELREGKERNKEEGVGGEQPERWRAMGERGEV